MADKPWFDEETGMFMLDEYVAEMPSFKKILEDGVITDDEILNHAQTVTALLKELDQQLSPQIKPVVTTALCELAVLFELQRLRQLPSAN